MGLTASPLGLLVEQNRDAIVAVALEHRARSISVFGSVARGETTSTSDIDFLVEFEPSSSLFDLIHLEEALQQLLGTSVDVLSVGGLLRARPQIR